MKRLYFPYCVIKHNRPDFHALLISKYFCLSTLESFEELNSLTLVEVLKVYRNGICYDEKRWGQGIWYESFKGKMNAGTRWLQLLGLPTCHAASLPGAVSESRRMQKSTLQQALGFSPSPLKIKVSHGIKPES